MMDHLMQLQFDLIHAQAMAHLPAYAMVLGCLLKVPIKHEYFQANIALLDSAIL